MNWTHSLTSWMSVALLSSTLAIAGCGGSDSSGSSSDDNTSDATLEGTAATGAAIDGFVYVTDASGTEVNVATEDDGSYTITVTGMTAPFLLRAIPDDGSDVQYSFAASANSVANITQLTTLAMFLANGEISLEVLQQRWSDAAASFSSDDLEDAQAQVNANFSEQFSDNGLNADSYDFFTAEFSANGNGFDAVLDLISIDINFSTGSFTVAVDGVVYDYDMDIDAGTDNGGIVIGGDDSDLDGEWTLTFSGTFRSGATTTVIPEVTIDGLEAPDSLSEIEDRVSDSYEASGSEISNLEVTTLTDTDTRKTFTLSFTLTTTVDVGDSSVDVLSDYDMTYDYQLD
ncbi:hypothetical protein Q4551_08440 [Oceanobacter sp. 5_MG-2023]|uniref:hypothetical protein n=1 Tax=Oceanobacter sp. 5_MG-2023 TaxID=3062645 RepID=UPI0026E3DB38|nr:hypothetical protein [Oceanobacter sp. 5_MG-2023]MDO6682315.1 hypothetical protein [Oceanobacter sp. 5_MG-2023]